MDIKELVKKNPTVRLALVVGGLLETALKGAALRDLKQRDAALVRGPKAVWTAIITLVNAFGAAPLAYFLVGRKKG